MPGPSRARPIDIEGGITRRKAPGKIEVRSPGVAASHAIDGEDFPGRQVVLREFHERRFVILPQCRTRREGEHGQVEDLRSLVGCQDRHLDLPQVGASGLVLYPLEDELVT